MSLDPSTWIRTYNTITNDVFMDGITLADPNEFRIFKGQSTIKLNASSVVLGYQISGITVPGLTSIGGGCLSSLAAGSSATGIGASAGTTCSTVNDSTFIGYFSGMGVVTSTGDVFIGHRTQGSATSTGAVAIGKEAAALGNYSVAIGSGANVSAAGVNSIAIGKNATVIDPNTCYIAADRIVFNAGSVQDLSGEYVRKYTINNTTFWTPTVPTLEFTLRPIDIKGGIIETKLYPPTGTSPSEVRCRLPSVADMLVGTSNPVVGLGWRFLIHNKGATVRLTSPTDLSQIFTSKTGVVFDQCKDIIYVISDLPTAINPASPWPVGRCRVYLFD